MAHQARLHEDHAALTGATNVTRSARSSTLPSQQSPPFKHKYRHRHHASTSHRSGHGHNSSLDSYSRHSPSSHTSALSPLGELLSPVKRNVTEGISGVANWIDRDRDRDKDRQRDKWRTLPAEEIKENKENIPERPALTLLDVEHLKLKRKAAERALEDRYNELASKTLEQHTTLADSRSNMLRMFGRVDATLTSLRKLRADASSLLDTLTDESIRELTDESAKQLQGFRNTITDMESNRIVKLQDRVSAARDSTTRLGDRMAAVRSRIEAWEEREAEEDRLRRRRVGIVWGTIGTMVLLVVLLLIWGRVNEQLQAGEEVLNFNWTDIVIDKERNESLVTDQELPIEQLLNSLKEDEFRKSPVLTEDLPGEHQTTESEDGRLASIFDEL